MNPVRLELRDAPVIGETASGQKIRLGGFSGLRFLGRSPTGLYQFLTHTDRGPNTDEKIDSKGRQQRPFGIPDFNPRLVFLDADIRLGRLFVNRQIPLTHKNGKPITGMPPEQNSEVAVDFKGQPLGFDANGLDLEGVAIAQDGTFWLAEEYGPSLVQFSMDGVLLERLAPGKGLPETLRYRRYNRGFESVAIQDKQIYAALESPLDNPPSEGQKNSRQSRITRIIQVDPVKKVAVAQYAYVLEEADSGKLNDMTFESPDVLLVLEKGKEFKRIYRVYLHAATNLQRLSSAISGPGGRLESMTERDLMLNSIAAVRKELVCEMEISDEKPEGIDRVDDKFVAVIFDNDFGLDGELDHNNGVALEKEKERFPALCFFPVEKRKR